MWQEEVLHLKCWPLVVKKELKVDRLPEKLVKYL